MKSRIEDCGGDIILNLDYWDCECEHDFIHPTTKTECPVCRSLQEDSPSARANEVLRYVKNKTANGEIVDWDYWSCSCKYHFIHSVEEFECPACGASQEYRTRRNNRAGDTP